MNNGNSSRRGSGKRFGGSRPSRARRSFGKFGQRSGSRSGGYRGKSYGKKQGIDVSRFVKKASFSEKKEIKTTHLFVDFNFSEKIQENIKRRGFVKPTPIQDQSILHIMEGKDVIGLANTGTGKTGAFLLPLINKALNDKTERILIIAPTRELCSQIENEFRSFAFGMGIFSTSCIGGMPIYKQIGGLKRNPNFVIGTPGRLKDLEKRGNLNLKSFKNVVVDEIDRMLDMGFIDIVKELVNKTDPKRQSLFFSATMPDAIKRLTSQFLNEPVTISVQVGQTADNVDQDIVRVNKASKMDMLKKILSNPEFKKVLVFSETKKDVEALAVGLKGHGFKVDSIHGDKRQHQRQRSLMQFREARINILIATDVAARGLDIKDITHVINYTIPQSYDDYVHRIGRTGRGDNKGKALTFV